MERLPVAAARILEQRSHVVPGALKITEHFFEVPRDYSSPSSGSLRLFARSAHKHTVPVDPPKDDSHAQTPYLLYLQGGPGFECRSPQSYAFTKSFLDKGYAMLYLDQRGTGLSSPITAATLKQQGDDEAQARHLSFFRADNIVRDAEAIRLALTKDWPEQKKKWSLIGQSFGGFCISTYLSLFPDSLKEAFVTGGLPPLKEKNPDNIYKRLSQKVMQRNEAYYQKYPEDVQRVKKIVQYLQTHGEGSKSGMQLPDRGTLSARRFLQNGISLGFHGGIDMLHDNVLRATSELDTLGFLARSTASTIASSTGGFDNSPIYFLLHEPIYCQGQSPEWSAQRVIDQEDKFNLQRSLDDPERKVYFTGEMVFPWMLDCYSELQAVAGAAELIAQKKDWAPLYEINVLKANKVPVYAAVYAEDMYVDYDLALDTAHTISGCKYFLTNRIYHDGLRSKMETIVDTLWKMRNDTID